MKIREQHKNGAQIQVSGIFGVRRFIEDWRAHQDTLPEEPKEEAEQPEPRKSGSMATVSGPVRRDGEVPSGLGFVPITYAQIGFQPND